MEVDHQGLPIAQDEGEPGNRKARIASNSLAGPRGKIGQQVQWEVPGRSQKLGNFKSRKGPGLGLQTGPLSSVQVGEWEARDRQRAQRCD